MAIFFKTNSLQKGKVRNIISRAINSGAIDEYGNFFRVIKLRGLRVYPNGLRTKCDILQNAEIYRAADGLRVRYHSGGDIKWTRDLDEGVSYADVPDTKRNRVFLASHYYDKNNWRIIDPIVDSEIKEIADELERRIDGNGSREMVEKLRKGQITDADGRVIGAVRNQLSDIQQRQAMLEARERSVVQKEKSIERMKTVSAQKVSPDDLDLEDLGITGLKKIAAREGLTLGPDIKRVDLIAMIRESRKTQEPNSNDILEDMLNDEPIREETEDDEFQKQIDEIVG